MPDYSKIKIYRLVSKNLEIKECYIGSTTNFTKRKANHKQSCNTETSKAYNAKKYIFIRENGGFENWDMVLVEDFPCNNSLEARQRERYWQEHFASELNTVKAYASEDQKKEQKSKQSKIYYEQNSEHFKEKAKIYRAENADKINEKFTCECGGKFTKTNKPFHLRTNIHTTFANL